MKLFFAVLFVILIVALQITIAQRLTIFGIAPSLVVALMIAAAIAEKEKKIALLILAALIFLDILVGEPFGIISLAGWLTFFLLKWLAKFTFKQSGLLSVITLVLIGAAFYELCLEGLGALANIFNLSKNTFFALDFYRDLPIKILYNGLLSLIFLGVKQRLGFLFVKH